jgi:hypothetical protein
VTDADLRTPDPPLAVTADAIEKANGCSLKRAWRS